jgi:hypothetical protein
MSEPTVWCPSCGAEYVAGSRYCSDCRVELVTEPANVPRGARVTSGRGSGFESNNDFDDDEDDESEELVELGEYPRLQAQILRRRLESAGISVLVEWTGPSPDATGTILVPDAQAEFANAVVNEIDVEDEVPDTSPEAYIIRIEEHLAAIGSLVEELRTRLDLER